MRLVSRRLGFTRAYALALLALVAQGCGGSATSPGGSSNPDASDSGLGAGGNDGSVSGDATTLDGSSADATTPRDSGAADASPKDAAVTDALVVDGGSVSTTITIDPATKIGAIGPDFVGFSYEKSHLQAGLFRGDNAALVAMFDLLGTSILRVGGNSVDSTVWQTFDAGTVADAAAPSYITAADVDGLAAFAQAAGWKVLYGVNMKLSNPDVAANEAAYAATALGASLFGFEIGNEPDIYTSIASVTGTWSEAAFTAEWRVFRDAMLASAPAAPFTGPAAAYNYKAWTIPFGLDAGSDITMLTQHYYVANGEADASTIDLLLSPNPTLDTELKALSAAATSDKIPNRYRLSECNSFYNGGAKGISDAYGTALWAIDFLFANAENGSTGTNFHGGGSGTGYTPIADSAGSVVEARPLFYGLLLFTKAGQGSVLQTSGGPDASVNFSSYAVAGAGGTTNVILSNKDRTTTVHATVDVGATVTTASALRLEGPALEATTGVTLGGVAISADGGFAPNAPEVPTTSGKTFVVDVPPASAVLVTAE